MIKMWYKVLVSTQSQQENMINYFPNYVLNQFDLCIDWCRKLNGTREEKKYDMNWLGSTPLKLRASIRFNELNGNVEYLKSIELTEPVICILGKVFNGTGESESDNRYTYIPIMVFVMTF